MTQFLLSLFSSENFDLLAVGITSAAIIILGVIVYINNTQSVTGRAFLIFATATVAYSLANYMNYQELSEGYVLLFLRLTLFTAVWHAYSFFHLANVFPLIKKRLNPLFTYGALGIVALTSFLTLSPFVLSGIATLAPPGQASTATHAPGILVFAIVVTILVVTGLYFLIRRTLTSKEPAEKRQLILLTVGVIITFALIIVFNVVLPVGFQNTSFILLAPVFFFPLLGLAAFSILRMHLFNIKIAAVALLSFLLAITVLLRVILSTNQVEVVFGISQFALVVLFSIWLLNATLKEVRLREDVETLASNLKIANEKLRELDTLKSQFLSIATHELRSPLTIVRNFVSLLLDGSYGKLPPAAEESAHQVFDRVTDMTKSVDNYLNVSRIEQGRIEYSFEPSDLSRLVHDVVAGMKGNAEKRKLSLNLSVAPGAEKLVVKMDSPKIAEVVTNLIDNSIKYTLQGSVNLTLERAGTKARLTIKDTGVGMTQKTMGNLFKLFSPGEDSKKINPASTGVGLYVSKSHVVAHGGTLVASSPGVNQGSQFVVELPITN